MCSIKKYLKRLRNPATIIGISSYVLIILTQLGVNVDENRIVTIIRCLSGILVLLGILNNPDTKGVDTPLNLYKNKTNK
ncbi:MAG: hypothetical protein WAX04_14435 [Oscillospiraceae bacterium]